MTDRSVPIRAAVQLYVFLSGVLLGAPTALLPPALRGDGPQPGRFHFFPVKLCGTLVPVSAGRMKFAVLCSVHWGWRSGVGILTPSKNQMETASLRGGFYGQSWRECSVISLGSRWLGDLPSGSRAFACARGHQREWVLSRRRHLQATRNLFTGFLAGSSSWSPSVS